MSSQISVDLDYFIWTLVDDQEEFNWEGLKPEICINGDLKWDMVASDIKKELSRVLGDEQQVVQIEYLESPRREINNHNNKNKASEPGFGDNEDYYLQKDNHLKISRMILATLSNGLAFPVEFETEAIRDKKSFLPLKTIIRFGDGKERCIIYPMNREIQLAIDKILSVENIYSKENTDFNIDHSAEKSINNEDSPRHTVFKIITKSILKQKYQHPFNGALFAGKGRRTKTNIKTEDINERHHVFLIEIQNLVINNKDYSLLATVNCKKEANTWGEIETILIKRID